MSPQTLSAVDVELTLACRWSCGRDLELELLAKLCNAAPNIKRLEINSLVVNGKLMSKETEEPIATNIASNLNGLQHLALVFGQSPWIDNSITRLIDRVLLPVLRRDSKLSYSAVFGSRHGMAMQPRLESVNSPFPMNTPIFSPVSTVTGLHLSGLSFDSVSISSRLSLPCLTHLEIDRCSGTTQLLNTLSHPQKPLPLTALIIRNVQKPPRQHGSRPYSPRNLDQALDAILQLCTKLKTLVIDRADNDRLRDLRL